MNRLTEKRGGKNVIPLRNAVFGVDVPYWNISRENELASFLYGDAADRLAAYEETGLTPEQIQEAVDLFEGSDDIHGEIMSWVERCTWHVRMCDKLAEELYRYKKADAEGRLLTLPCPIGTTVYIITAVVSRGYPDPVIANVIREEKFSYEHIGISPRYLFLSYEEAEAALKGRQNA